MPAPELSGWRCEKCGEPKVFDPSNPTDRISPSLVDGIGVGYCRKCKRRQTFRRDRASGDA